jgi:hypothetical protein
MFAKYQAVFDSRILPNKKTNENKAIIIPIPSITYIFYAPFVFELTFRIYNSLYDLRMPLLLRDFPWPLANS